MKFLSIKYGIYSRVFAFFNRRKFKKFGKESSVIFPLKIDGVENIEIGDKVYIGYKTWIAALPLTNMKSELIINSGCRIGNFNHIYATNSIVIEDNVLTADKVYISDNLHSYENINVPIFDQPIKQLKKLTIGAGSWLGENVCVIGANVGRNCVIGANSVVTKDIPDYCVAVGAPAKVIKKYCLIKRKWVKISSLK